jgi:3-phenylpropionate/cinnamic acid dioxygenase small subunit
MAQVEAEFQTTTHGVTKVRAKGTDGKWYEVRVQFVVMKVEQDTDARTPDGRPQFMMQGNLAVTPTEDSPEPIA